MRGIINTANIIERNAIDARKVYFYLGGVKAERLADSRAHAPPIIIDPLLHLLANRSLLNSHIVIY